MDFLNRFRITGGLRFDYFDFSTFSSVSPRLGFSWFISPRITFNLAYGKHFQSPSYVVLNAHPKNNELDNKYTEQYVAGLEYLIAEDMRVTFEVYQKSYFDIPVSRGYTTPNPFDNFEGQRVNAGEAKTTGFEVFFQKKLTKSFSSIISYSYSVSEAVDPRSGETYNWDYDYRNVFTLVTGYKFFWREKTWFQEFKKSTVYQFVSWFPLVPADEDEISMQWRYTGGRPYTPPVYHPEYQDWFVGESQPFNTSGLPNYHRLDIRLDKRYIFESFNLVSFLDVINIYGRDNLWNYNYNDDGTRSKVLQFQTILIGGFSLEF